MLDLIFGAKIRQLTLLEQGDFTPRSLCLNPWKISCLKSRCEQICLACVKLLELQLHLFGKFLAS